MEKPTDDEIYGPEAKGVKSETLYSKLKDQGSALDEFNVLCIFG